MSDERGEEVEAVEVENDKFLRALAPRRKKNERSSSSTAAQLSELSSFSLPPALLPLRERPFFILPPLLSRDQDGTPGASSPGVTLARTVERAKKKTQLERAKCVKSWPIPLPCSSPLSSNPPPCLESPVCSFLRLPIPSCRSSTSSRRDFNSALVEIRFSVLPERRPEKTHDRRGIPKTLDSKTGDVPCRLPGHWPPNRRPAWRSSL